MSRKTHTWKEIKAFKILRDALINRAQKIDKSTYLIKEQVDSPDFAFIMKNNRNGIEVCAIDNPKLREANNIKTATKNSNAKKKELKAIESNQPYTIVNQTTSIGKDIFEKVLLKKFELYQNYKNNGFQYVYLVLHTESYGDKRLYEALRYNLNSFCIEKDCPFDKVFLIDFKHKKYIGKAFDKKSKKKISKPLNLVNLKSESYCEQYFPVGKSWNIWGNYEIKLKNK